MQREKVFNIQICNWAAALVIEILYIQQKAIKISKYSDQKSNQ